MDKQKLSQCLQMLYRIKKVQPQWTGDSVVQDLSFLGKNLMPYGNCAIEAVEFFVLNSDPFFPAFGAIIDKAKGLYAISQGASSPDKCFNDLKVLIVKHGRDYKPELEPIMKRLVDRYGGWYNLCQSKEIDKDRFDKIYNEELLLWAEEYATSRIGLGKLSVE